MNETFMPPTSTLPLPPKPVAKVRVSWVSILFVVILTIVLIILGERFLFDLNRWFNPAYDQYGYHSYIYSSTPEKVLQYPNRTQTFTLQDYEARRLAIHGAFVIPVLLAGFLLYFWLNFRKEKSTKYIIAWPYFIFSIWMVIHLVIEALYFLIKQYKAAGLYVVLIILAGLLTWLIIFAEKRFHDRQHPAV